MAIIGGSRHMHGAPLFAALSAEATGVDLLYVCLPACHEEQAKSVGLNMMVYPFQGNELYEVDREPILELLATMDCAVIGPGIARTKESIAALSDIVAEAQCTLILDASALQKGTLKAVQGKSTILTPHLGELERMEIETDTLSDVAKEAEATILLKGPTDTIVSADGNISEVQGGNAGLTVGGTGDVLAGCIAGLVAQGEEHTAACIRASTLVKKSGELLLKEIGYAYTATDVIETLSHLLTNDSATV